MAPLTVGSSPCLGISSFSATNILSPCSQERQFWAAWIILQFRTANCKTVTNSNERLLPEQAQTFRGSFLHTDVGSLPLCSSVDSPTVRSFIYWHVRKLTCQVTRSYKPRCIVCYYLRVLVRKTRKRKQMASRM